MCTRVYNAHVYLALLKVLRYDFSFGLRGAFIDSVAHEHAEELFDKGAKIMFLLTSIIKIAVVAVGSLFVDHQHPVDVFRNGCVDRLTAAEFAVL